jgi:hypothetical protein
LIRLAISFPTPTVRPAFGSQNRSLRVVWRSIGPPEMPLRALIDREILCNTAYRHTLQHTQSATMGAIAIVALCTSGPMKVISRFEARLLCLRLGTGPSGTTPFRVSLSLSRQLPKWLKDLLKVTREAPRLPVCRSPSAAERQSFSRTREASSETSLPEVRADERSPMAR